LLIVILFRAAYVGLATVAGFIWWFVYYDNGPKLPYTELVSSLEDVPYIDGVGVGLAIWVKLMVIRSRIGYTII